MQRVVSRGRKETKGKKEEEEEKRMRQKKERIIFTVRKMRRREKMKKNEIKKNPLGENEEKILEGERQTIMLIPGKWGTVVKPRCVCVCVCECVCVC